MKNINLLLSLCALFLSACTVGPDYVKPDAPNVASYTAEGNEKYTSSISTEWWKSFQTPALNKVIEQGIKNNYSLQSMQETLQQAEANVSATKGQNAPQINLNTDAGYEKYGVEATGNTNDIPAFHYYSFGPSINWALDIFGGTKRSIEQQQALKDYQQQELHATFLTLTGNIVTTSMRIAELNAQISTIQSIIRDDQKNLDLAQTGLNLGSATEENKLLMQSQLSQDETLLTPLQQKLSATQGELNILVGAFPADWQPPQFQLENFTLPKTLPLTLPSQLVHNRPDILAAEALLHAANAGVGIATANLYPQINLSANLTQEALSPGQLFNAASTTASVVGGITAPIFSGGTLRAQKNAAEHAYKATYANYQDVVVRAFVQVSNVLHALKYDDENIAAQKKAMASAEASLKLARLGNQVGSSTELEILNTQRLYAQAKIDYAQAIAQRYRDAAQLYLVLGGGVVA
ncbi:MAG: efflux transporter outer membrane subunit [Pseudomonadota bacterium]